jgi:hypothetical protein
MKKMLLFQFLLITGIAQSQITPASPDAFPGHRQDASLIFHPPTGELLLLGGTTPSESGPENDVWKWNGRRWSKITASGPGSRYFFAMARNPTTDNISGFGGEGSDERSRGDMWSFDSKIWSKVATNDIGTRDHHKMVFAEHLKAFVMYGGNRNGEEDTVTWIFRDNTFTPLKIKGPGVRYHSGMVYDKHRKKVVLYGGGTKPDQHWEFDGAKWTRITTKVNPGRKLYHSMIYCDSLKGILLHGGWINQDPRDPRNAQTPETWLWNGTNWSKVGEHRLFTMAMGYDPIRNTVVAYGFTDDYGKPRDIVLSEWKNGKWTRIANYRAWVDKK